MGSEGKTVALLMAAGSGSRAGGALPKQFRRIGAKSVLDHAVGHLRHPDIDEIRVVIGPGQEGLFAEAVPSSSLPSPTIGGETRQQSVQNGLNAIEAAGGASRVLIHDAARPFLPALVIDRLLHGLERYPGAVPVLPVADTLAAADGLLGDSIPRDGVVRIQTPQAFRFHAILAAHREWNRPHSPTDDAQVLRAAGLEVTIVAGDAALEKLTFEEDFARAHAMIDASMPSRTGLGFDVHAFCEGDHIWLGGLRIPHSRGLAGHSDADVILHAITDALLGAIAAGDIGDHFPPTDSRWRGAASSLFVEHARSLIAERGGRIEHVDVTIICEQPRLAPYRDTMRQNVAAVLQLPATRISIKATTTERLGFTGRGEGIAAQAIATVRVPEDR